MNTPKGLGSSRTVLLLATGDRPVRFGPGSVLKNRHLGGGGGGGGLSGGWGVDRRKREDERGGPGDWLGKLGGRARTRKKQDLSAELRHATPPYQASKGRGER